jgi:hypothetical protein
MLGITLSQFDRQCNKQKTNLMILNKEIGFVLPKLRIENKEAKSAPSCFLERFGRELLTICREEPSRAARRNAELTHSLR